MNQGGFLWKRLIGITRAKSSIPRTTGIPLTKSGRQRKIGRAVTRGGCLVLIMACELVPHLLIIGLLVF
jgi:hypothetical protein